MNWLNSFKNVQKKYDSQESVILWEQYEFIWKIPFMRSFWQYKGKDTTNDSPNYSEEQDWYPRSSHFRLKFTLVHFFSNFLSNHRWKTEYFIDVLTQKGCSKVEFLFCKNALEFGWSHERAKCMKLILR